MRKSTRNPLWLLGKSGAYAVLVVGLVATLLPFFYIMVSSLKTEAELRQTPPDFFPAKPTLKHYTTILTDTRIPLERNLFNSVFVSIMRVGITLFTSSFAGYIFAKYHFKGKNLAFGVILIQITLNAGRTVELKKALFARIVQLLRESPGVRPEDVFVGLVEVPKENWSFGNGIAQYATS